MSSFDEIDETRSAGLRANETELEPDRTRLERGRMRLNTETLIQLDMKAVDDSGKLWSVSRVRKFDELRSFLEIASILFTRSQLALQRSSMQFSAQRSS